MIELITVCVVSAIAFSVWCAAFIAVEKSVIKGVAMAIFVPAILISMILLTIWIVFSFGKVLG